VRGEKRLSGRIAALASSRELIEYGKVHSEFVLLAALHCIPLNRF
jgi:hypothetical protein